MPSTVRHGRVRLKLLCEQRTILPLRTAPGTVIPTVLRGTALYGTVRLRAYEHENRAEHAR